LDVKLNSVFRLIMDIHGYCEGVKMPLKKPAYSCDQSDPCSPKWTDIEALRALSAIGDLLVVAKDALEGAGTSS